MLSTFKYAHNIIMDAIWIQTYYERRTLIHLKNAVNIFELFSIQTENLFAKTWIETKHKDQKTKEKNQSKTEFVVLIKSLWVK